MQQLWLYEDMANQPQPHQPTGPLFNMATMMKAWNAVDFNQPKARRLTDSRRNVTVGVAMGRNR